MASAHPELAASPWFAGECRRAVRSGATKMEFSERVSCYTTTRTVTVWYRSGRAERVARTAQAAAAAAPKGPAAQAAAAAQAPAATRAAADGAPRAARNARQRRSAERSARHHQRMAKEQEKVLPEQEVALLEQEAGGATEAWTMADVQRVGGVDNNKGSARCATEPRSPSKRARDEAPGRRRSPGASPSKLLCLHDRKWLLENRAAT